MTKAKVLCTHTIHRFLTLPPCVKVLLTTRPQALVAFDKWDPVWIQPNADHNLQDMRLLVETRLMAGGFVQERDMGAAVELVVRKSQGQFIYSKYLFDDLAARHSAWTLDELQASLPDGLAGFFRHALVELEGAAKQDGAASLWWALRERVLPVLVAAQEPLTVEQLVFFTGEGESVVRRLLQVLGGLFPCRVGGMDGAERVYP
jgi:hypothetical protein